MSQSAAAVFRIDAWRTCSCVTPHWIGWTHVGTDEVECLPVHKLDVLAHCLTGRRTLLQQCCMSLAGALRQQHINSINSLLIFKENEVDAVGFQCRDRGNYELAESGTRNISAKKY